MTKMHLFGSSFVAAIPGAALAYLMLMVVLNHFENIPMILKVVVIATLVMAGSMLLFPAWVLIWYGGRGKKSDAPAAVATATAGDAVTDEEAVEDLDVDEEVLEADDDADGFGDDDFAEDEFEADEALDDDIVSSADDMDVFEADDDFAAEADMDEEFEFDDFEDDEEFK